MSVYLVLRCGGCVEAPKVEVGPLRRRFHGSHGDWGFGHFKIDDPQELTPEGWVMFDPYTQATYCPECWATIEGTDAAVSPTGEEK